MAYADNDDLKRACEALRIRDVWAVAFSDGVVTKAPPDRDGLVESPFRDDGKKGSFSICHDGHGFKDFGGNGLKGGAWKFHALCWPNLTDGDRAKQMIELAVRCGHITETVRPPRPAPGTPAAAAEVPESVLKAAKAIERKARVRDAEEAVWRQREQALRAPAAKVLPRWPGFVAEHFAEGLTHVQEPAGKKRVAELAASRGWPEAWAWELVERELLAWPWERWAKPCEKWAARQRAFAVHQPLRDSLGVTTLVPVGYHQLFYEPARDGKPEYKGWLYVPSLPKWKPRSALEEQLDAYGETLGVAAEPRGRAKPAVIGPLPFVLGDLQAPKVIVLLEGQWDAVTFFGACGWFHDTTPAEGVAVFGIRGAQGVEAFLSHWGEWLRKHRPRAWLIADNDAAGRTWREAPAAEPGLPRPPGLAERLEHAGARERATIVSWLKPGAWGKDFNDYYRAAKPTADKMRGWMLREGVVDAGGQWA